MIETTGARFSINMVSTVSAQGQLRFMGDVGRMDADHFIEFLKRLTYRATNPAFLILDGYPAQEAKRVED